MLNLNNIQKIHFIGAGGASMSALAKLMILEGKTVSGSDTVYSKNVEELVQWGADIVVGHDQKRIREVDLVVYSLAIGERDPERQAASDFGIPSVPRHHFLQGIASQFDTVIAVAGTHGKTTTASMIAHVFKRENLAFTAHIGGDSAYGNLLSHGKQYFVTEACEYQKSFLSLASDVAVVLNVEEDHPDTFPTKESLNEGFLQFVKNRKKDGIAILNGESDFFLANPTWDSKVQSFGYEGSFTCTAGHMREHKNGCYAFQISENGVPTVQVELNIFGQYNVLNALAAYLVCKSVGIAPEKIAEALGSFTGVKRRFEHRGQVHGAQVFVDYAHHPSALSGAIATAKQLATGSVHVVFQPHTYSRTARLFEAFAVSLAGADVAYLFKEFPSRESPKDGKSCRELYQFLFAATEMPLGYFDSQLSLARTLWRELKPGDVLLIAGAGDIDMLADLLEYDDSEE